MAIPLIQILRPNKMKRKYSMNVEQDYRKFRRSTEWNRQILACLVISYLVLYSACSWNGRSVGDGGGHPSPTEILPNHESLCELLLDSRVNDGDTISVRAIIVVGREYTYLYDPRCRGTKEFELWPINHDNELGEKIDSLASSENAEFVETGLIRLQVDFEGIVRTKSSGFGPRGYYLRALEIRRATNISSVPETVPYPWQ